MRAASATIPDAMLAMDPVDRDNLEDAAWRRLHAEAAKTLAARIKQYEIPMEGVYQPTYDVVLVCRLPDREKKTKTDGGLYIPETAQSEPNPESVGVLLKAGLEARDFLRSHGFLLGDLVRFGRYEGSEEDLARDVAGTSKIKLLQLRAMGLLGSHDLDERLWGKKPTMRITWEEGPDGGAHLLRPVI